MKISSELGAVGVTISNDTGDDFAQGAWKLRATAHGHAAVWKIPDRLVNNEALFKVILEELVAELHDEVEKGKK